MAERPIGVIIIAILQLLGSLAMLGIGALALLAGMMIPILGFILMALGAFMIIWGIIGIILFWGLWGMKSWAWLITIIFNIISIVLGIYNFYSSGYMDYTALINVIIPLIIVIYLFFVREHFQ